MDQIRNELEKIRLKTEMCPTMPIPMARLSFLFSEAKRKNQMDAVRQAVQITSELLAKKGALKASREILRLNATFQLVPNAPFGSLSPLEKKVVEILINERMSLRDLAERLYGSRIQPLSAERRTKNLIARLRQKARNQLLHERGVYRFVSI